IEKACEVSRGADRIEMLRFACQFAEFGGWIFQDAGDLTCAMQWTNRALDYALELGDERVIAYTLMRKAMIATEGGTPAQGLGIADCHPPASWDQVEGFSAMSMGPPGRH